VSATTDGELLEACDVVTRPAEGVVAQIHDRMPIIVPRQGYAGWLARDARFDSLREVLNGDARELEACP
jgi:putative SOS response-associated peptidase YedK